MHFNRETQDDLNDEALRTVPAFRHARTIPCPDPQSAPWNLDPFTRAFHACWNDDH
ncbi:MAG: hypothetical protein WDO73_26610 [Ignavibacteriota bacterium]